MPRFRRPPHRRQRLRWVLCPVLLTLLAALHVRSTTNTRLVVGAAPRLPGRRREHGSSHSKTTGGRALPRLVAAVNETRFPPQDWWEVPNSSFPCCAIIKCDQKLDCLSDDRSCCAYWLRGLLNFTAAFFDAHGLPWLVTYGTLLGAVRNQSLIPWTTDIDIGLPMEAWEQVTGKDSRRLRRDAWRYGFMVLAGQHISASRFCYHPGHPELAPPPEVALQAIQQTPGDRLPRVYADLYSMAALEGPNQYKFTLGNDHLQSLSASFTARYTIDGLSVPGPDNATACLVAWYGEDYMTPKVT